MAIKKAVSKTHFTQIPNETLREHELSDGAHRLLTYMLSFSDEWVFHNEVMAKDLNKKPRTIQNYLTELSTFGYIARNPIRDESGKIKDWERIVYDSPQKEAQLPDAEFRHVANGDT